MLILDSGILLALSLSCGWNFWSLCSRTALYSCKGRNRWQSAHELMSSQAREKSALTNDIQICVIHLATNVTSVAVLLWLLCYFGCKLYLRAVMNMKCVQLLCNMQLEYVTILFLRFFDLGLWKKYYVGVIRIRFKACCLLIKPTLAVEYGNNGSIIRWESTLPIKKTKPYRWIASTLPKTLQVLLRSRSR